MKHEQKNNKIYNGEKKVEKMNTWRNVHFRKKYKPKFRFGLKKRNKKKERESVATKPK